MARKLKKAEESRSKPKELCSYCDSEINSCFVTHVSSKEGEAGKPVCAECLIRSMAERMGISPPTKFEFPPISLFDSVGKKHPFHFDVRMSTGLGITTYEKIGDGFGGYTFSVLDHPETDIDELYDRLLKKMMAGLAQKYLKAETFGDFNPWQSKLYIKGSAVNGTISERENPETGEWEQIVVVDGQELTWQQFGKALSPFTGFGFRIECFDLTDSDIEISADPEKPDALWWLNLPKHNDDQEESFQ